MKLTYEKKGRGFLNKVINNLPVELHIPGYQYCGPGTKLKDRLARGDPGVNPLDVACKNHDIAYSQNADNLSERHAADKILVDKARNRIFAKDSNFSEKVAAITVSNIINLKRKMGMSLCKNKKLKKIKKKMKKSGKGLKKKTTFRKIIDSAKKLMNRKKDPIDSALAGARKAIIKAGGKKHIRIPRIIPISSKIGGILPLIPIFAGLSALGSIASGASSVIKALNTVNSAKQHVGNGAYLKPFSASIGNGAYLKPYKTGLGLFLSKN